MTNSLTKLDLREGRASLEWQSKGHSWSQLGRHSCRSPVRAAWGSCSHWVCSQGAEQAGSEVTLPPVTAPPRSLPKHCHRLGTKCAHTWTCGELTHSEHSRDGYYLSLRISAHSLSPCKDKPRVSSSEASLGHFRAFLWDATKSPPLFVEAAFLHLTAD